MTIGKALRFEVLKRDKFTCQYCGAKAPDVLLHVDHVHPESKGGDATMLNLVTACVGCNLGKSDRLLSDDAAVSKQQAQMEALAERREQVQMLVEWRAELAALAEECVEAIGAIVTHATGKFPSPNDENVYRRLLKRFSFEEVACAVDDAIEQYAKVRPTPDANVDRLMKMLPRICAARRTPDYEIKKQAAYAFGIVRNRWGANAWSATPAIEAALRRGVTVDTVNRICRHGDGITATVEDLEAEKP